MHPYLSRDVPSVKEGKKHTAGLSFASLFSVMIEGCVAPTYTGPPHPSPQKHYGKVVHVEETITVREGSTFDGKGNLYQWVGEGDCSQNKNSQDPGTQVIVVDKRKSEWHGQARDPLPDWNLRPAR